MLVDAAAEARKPGVARRAVNDMRAAGLQPDVIIMTCLMESYAAAGDAVRARAVLGEMRADGITPSVHSYTVLMQLLGNQGERAGRARRGKAQWLGAAPAGARRGGGVTA